MMHGQKNIKAVCSLLAADRWQLVSSWLSAVRVLTASTE